jgi:hypothetical protein
VNKSDEKWKTKSLNPMQIEQYSVSLKPSKPKQITKSIENDKKK